MIQSIKYLIVILIIIGFQQNAHPKQKNYQSFEYIRMIAEGNSEHVSIQLPELRKKFSNSPVVYYIEGLIASDGNEAIRYFRIIADSFSRSEWADDALVRLAEIYNGIGMQEPMKHSLARLHAEYPESPYIKTNYISNIEEITNKSTTIPERRLSAEYTIQVGAFSKIENAKKLQRQLKNEGYSADIYENLLDGKNLLYLLWIGTYKSVDEAKHSLKNIKSKHKINGLIRARSAWKKW